MKRLYDKVTAYKNLLEGWTRVRENYGCPGVDRVTVRRFENRLHQKGMRYIGL